MDNRHCLSYTIGKKDEMERMYLLVKSRSKFGNKKCSQNERTGERQDLPLESVARMGCRVAGGL